MLYADGRNRDNAYYSIIDDEWSQIRARLEEQAWLFRGSLISGNASSVRCRTIIW